MSVAIPLNRRVSFNSMRTKLNLSRRPFTNRRLFWLAILSIWLFCGAFFVWMVGQKVEADARSADLNRQILERSNSIDEMKKKLDARKPDVKLTELTPDQTYQLAAARQLIDRRAFSWNHLFSDIEKFVPNDARISSIRIQETGKNGESAVASVEIKAAGKTTAQMTEMMSKLENSGGLFAVDQASQDATDETGIVPFTLKLIYRPIRSSNGGDEQ